jgi:hypothetical protein
MWSLIKVKSPVLYLDATGSILKKLDGQGPIFMYSLVAHDPETKNIISIADFFSSSHASVTISKYLSSIKHNLMKYHSHCTPPFIVTDHSIALMNSVLQTFNNTTMLEYLHYVYRFLLIPQNKKTIEFSLCKLQICSAHFLKIITRKARTLKVEKKVFYFFVFAFTILQNASSMIDFNRYLLHIYNVLMNPRINSSLCTSYNILKVS